ncbi:MAG TPA: pyridoxamine 5'-phosphate oxidase family protein [Ramlibacter sp.]|uniref:HugZ family pyridoxamine 5'-phosphate oxidase n=1 Tax=Ramlibacter sp. TaxID=1917967 RepID=UPI002C48E302|nr:pyridoxamine 5'-phosphate oxidase family protein [Ramlibacter sp.]HVZ46210.1 pyridoxamine 5'-phosphate oxidase family protein [Ramlibacter sp.]
MDEESSRLLRSLLDTRRVAALATLHRGEPAASMVPFVLASEDARLLIHVSELATHTRDMLETPRVSVLVAAGTDGPWLPHALPRVSLQCDARPLERSGGQYASAKSRYLDCFAEAEQMFELGDFSLFALGPISARLVAGFGRAYSLAGDALQAWLRTRPGDSGLARE